jgi:polysaccharide biosynthesis protein PelE
VAGVSGSAARGWGVGLLGVGVLDGVDLGMLLTSADDGPRVSVLLMVRALLAAGSAAMLTAASRPRSRREAWAIAVAGASLAFFVPVLGAFGLFVAVGLASREAGSRGREAWTRLSVDPERMRIPLRPRRDVSASAIAAVLADRAPEHAARRFEAILRSADLPPRVGIRLLKSALRDPAEEVRLFAFSRIERLRADLDHALETFRQGLEAAEDDAARAHLRLRLAETHWELAYLGLAEGAVLEHALDAAVENARESCRVGKNPAAACFLLGRVLLFRRQTDAAVVELQRACRLGYAMAKVLPYLAECAFEARSFGAVRVHLEQLERISRGHAPLALVRQMWR